MSSWWAVVFPRSGSDLTLVLSELRWFARRGPADRIRPYVVGGWQRHQDDGPLSVASFREVVAPLATSVGEVVSRGFGVHEPLAARLKRFHSASDPTIVRIQQLGWSTAGLLAGAVVAGLVSAPPAPALLLVAGTPLLAFLVIEQQVASRSQRWQRRLFLELPIVSEQIGMLLSAGYSLGGALDRIADRGAGACSRDLDRVRRRVRQGLSESEALREWSELAQVPAVSRFVGVLTLNRETTDLGRLIAEEARSIRREAHRELIAHLDRRAQQVWVPVTVATLVPGTVLLAIPFLQAMQVFTER
ncbi:MAG: type II secretion system F family protein [Acidimicrobiales bacterium]